MMSQTNVPITPRRRLAVVIELRRYREVEPTFLGRESRECRCSCPSGLLFLAMLELDSLAFAALASLEAVHACLAAWGPLHLLSPFHLQFISRPGPDRVP